MTDAIKRAASNIRIPWSFPNDPDVRYNMGAQTYRYRSPYSYEWRDKRGRLHCLTIESGYEMDGASVPQRARALVPDEPLHKSAGFHDLLYERVGIPRAAEHLIWKGKHWQPANLRWTRKQVDKLFLRMLLKDHKGPNKLEARLAYWGVRIGGWVVWNRHKKKRAPLPSARVVKKLKM